FLRVLEIPWRVNVDAIADVQVHAIGEGGADQEAAPVEIKFSFYDTGREDADVRFGLWIDTVYHGRPPGGLTGRRWNFQEHRADDIWGDAFYLFVRLKEAHHRWVVGN